MCGNWKVCIGHLTMIFFLLNWGYISQFKFFLACSALQFVLATYHCCMKLEPKNLSAQGARTLLYFICSFTSYLQAFSSEKTNWKYKSWSGKGAIFEETGWILDSGGWNSRNRYSDQVIMVQLNKCSSLLSFVLLQNYLNQFLKPNIYFGIAVF